MVDTNHSASLPSSRADAAGLLFTSLRAIARRRVGLASSWYDLAVVALLTGLGLAFLWNARRWGSMAYIGNQQYGDADFWWQGALQFSNAMIWNNINLTFRMGYAVLTGLFVAVLGPNFLVYHKLLCLVFLAAAATIYLAARRFLGRITATGLATLLVFAPYQAEWLAISTSDSTGLILNLLALVCLMMALRGAQYTWWDAGFGFLLAIGALTRPLMALFIAPAILLRLAAPASWRQRVMAVATLLFAFLLPVGAWVAAYHAHTGNMALAGYDSSAFYAASNPKYQAWRPDMYPPIEAAARKRFGTASTGSLTPAQLSQEFWIETVQNYITYYRYHLERIPRTIAIAANFRYEAYNGDAKIYAALRAAIIALLAAFLVFDGLRRDRVANVVAVAAVAALWFGIPAADKYVVIGAAMLLPVLAPVVGVAPAAVPMYWWTGVAAVYLTGGINGPPVASDYTLNALGYRLGSQFFFANDWLAALGLWLAARMPLPALAPWTLSNWLNRGALAVWERYALQPRRTATMLLRTSGVALLVALVGLAGAGAARVGVRAWRQAHVPPTPMPNVLPTVAAFCAGPGGGRVPNADGPPVVVTDPQPFTAMTSAAPAGHEAKALIATGALSPLIWQVPTEQRTMALFFQQAERTPFRMTSDHTTVDFSGLLQESAWRNRQGLWLFRSFPEAAPRIDYVFYESHPQVQAFIPFTPDDSGYALESATWFPLTQYASTLVATGATRVSGARLDWQTFPSGDRYRRWFVLMPLGGGPATADRAIITALDRALGQRSLTLQFRVEPIPGLQPPANQSGVYVEVLGLDVRSGAEKRLLAKASPARGGAADVALDSIATPLPSNIRQVTVTFHDVARTEMVRVMEFKVTADDFTPTAADMYCRRPTDQSRSDASAPATNR